MLIVRETTIQGFKPVCSAGHICLLALLLSVGIVRASEEAAKNKLIPIDEKDDGGRFFFGTSSTTTSDDDSAVITLTLGIGDILLAVLALALSVGLGVVIAGLFLGDTNETTGYTAPA